MSNFRKLALKKICANVGALTKLVQEKLNIKQDKPKFITLGSAGPGTVVFMTPDCVQPDGSVNIIINLRGVPGAERYVSNLGVDKAVVVTAEAQGPQSKNMGSALLEEQFGSAARVNQIVSSVLNHLQKQFPDKNIKRGKLALSGFSGGGGAISKIVSQENQIKGGIDSIAIADGLHSKPGSPGMEAIVEFAKKAQKDPSKKFRLLHTAVPTSYTSTTQAANYILSQLELDKNTNTTPTEFGFTPKAIAQSGNTQLITMYDEVEPYMLQNKPNVPGTSGYQHIMALQKGLPYLLKDIF